MTTKLKIKTSKAIHLILGAGMVLMTPVGFAHEGHDVLPGALQAQHGGTVKATKDLFLELVQEGNALRLYPTDHDKKPIPLSSLKVTATAQLPRDTKKPAVPLTTQTGSEAVDAHFAAALDPKKLFPTAKSSQLHRYTLEVSIEYKGKKDKATFQIEPKS